MITHTHLNATGFAKRGLICAIINTEKSCFKILVTVYLKYAWCLVYEILHQSIVIQGNSAGALFDGLLAEFPTILDSFFHQYHKSLHRGGWSGVVGSNDWRGKHTLCSYTCFMDPLVLKLAQKVVKPVDNTLQGRVRPHSLVAFVGQPAETTEYKPGIHGRLIWLRKQPQEKQIGERLATKHAHMDCLMVSIEWW